MYKSMCILSLVVSIGTSFDVDSENRKSKFLLVELREKEIIQSNSIQSKGEGLAPGARGLPLHS